MEEYRRLNDFDPVIRAQTLADLGVAHRDAPETSENVNMHMHSFFSYNAEGWSPSRIAWESRQRGLYAAGLCDFDVLDGMEEFQAAGLDLGLRTAVFLETRAYVSAFAHADINSPGEPGVSYIMGAGFTQLPAEGSSAAATLGALRQQARERNIALVDRINAAVPDVAIDYETDVLPSTPAGVATERHIISAYINKATSAQSDVPAFWGEVLGGGADAVREKIGTPALDEAVRAKFAKRGGLGYIQPSKDTFPASEEFLSWVRDCGAIPMIAWLDGMSEGEGDAAGLVTCLVEQGAESINIIPDRNWNLPDPDAKIAKLDEIIRVSRDAGLPINIGTEMNKAGLPFVDDLSGPVLSRHRQDFLQGAQVMVGHSILQTYAGFGFSSDAAATTYADRKQRAAFFASVGALPPLTRPAAENLLELGPDRAITDIQDAVGNGDWRTH